MAKWNPFSKSYDVKCCNGEKKTVYKDVDKAFPLFLNGFDAQFSSKLKNDILKEGEISGTLQKSVEGLLYGLDEINNGMMMSFRSAYVGYQADPCSNNGFLLEQIERINGEQQRLVDLKIRIKGYVALAKDGTGDKLQLAEHYKSLIDAMGDRGLMSKNVPNAVSESVEAAKNMGLGEDENG